MIITTGIYLIFNLRTLRGYVGSATDIIERWKIHIRALDSTNELYQENKELQLEWNRYGKDSFTFEILEECDREIFEIQRFYKEDQWIRSLQTSYYRDGGYNIADPLQFPKFTMLGRFHTNETKKKMSKSAIGKHFASEDTRKKMSAAKKGIPRTEEAKQKVSEGHKGIIFSEEHKRHLSESAYARTKNLCRPCSEETKEKIREGLKKYYANKKLDK
jgi:group I intron endonuclease